MKIAKIKMLIMSVLMVMILTFHLPVKAGAVSITLHSDNQGITSMSYSVSGYTIDILETWGTSGYGFLEFSGLENLQDYTIIKHITNSTGTDWLRFSNELLDPYNASTVSEDVLYDPQPYPGWVPTGYSTSNDHDGLSFAQAAAIPRTSVAFSGLIVDELTDARDFLDFFTGTVSGSGGTDMVSFGLRESFNTQQPFLLAERPNEFAKPVPEPSTLLLLSAGLIGLALCGGRKLVRSRG